MGAIDDFDVIYRATYQIVAVDRRNKKHVVFETPDRDKAIERLKLIDELSDYPDLLVQTENCQSIELVKTAVINKITWNEVKS